MKKIRLVYRKKKIFSFFFLCTVRDKYNNQQMEKHIDKLVYIAHFHVLIEKPALKSHFYLEMIDKFLK